MKTKKPWYKKLVSKDPLENPLMFIPLMVIGFFGAIYSLLRWMICGGPLRF